MSQVVFAEKCGFYQTYLSRIETGQANPTLNAIEVIANALDMSVFDLFDRVKAVQPPPQDPSLECLAVEDSIPTN
jgi:transcriptional regulator with XRE-family HTH domain